MALGDSLADLAQDGVGLPASRRAADERDHAERTREAASVLNANEGAHAIEPRFALHTADRADVSRDELLKEALGYHDYPSLRTIDNHILKLRQKLERDPENPTHFLTTYRSGYRFVRGIEG